MPNALIMIEKAGDGGQGDENDIAFWDNGTLSACCCSYQIDSFGCIDLNQKETRKLYDVMKKYYKEEVIS